MALTLEDIQQIKAVAIEVVDERLEPRFMRMESLIESVAVAAKAQFDNVYERFDVIEARFNALNERFNQIDTKLVDIGDDMITYKAIAGDHGFRITKLEHQHKPQANLA